MEGRRLEQCVERWKYLENDCNHGHWTEKEDIVSIWRAGSKTTIKVYHVLMIEHLIERLQ